MGPFEEITEGTLLAGLHHGTRWRGRRGCSSAYLCSVLFHEPPHSETVSGGLLGTRMNLCASRTHSLFTTSIPVSKRSYVGFVSGSSWKPCTKHFIIKPSPRLPGVGSPTGREEFERRNARVPDPICVGLCERRLLSFRQRRIKVTALRNVSKVSTHTVKYESCPLKCIS